MDLKTEVLTVDGITVTCREPLGMDRYAIRAVLKKLDYDRDAVGVEMATAFAEHVTRSTVEGIDWWTEPNAEEAVLNAAFNEWQRLSAVLIDKWDNALWRLDPRSFTNASG